MNMLFHITTRADYADAQAQGQYLPPPFAVDGFVHCSFAHQVAPVANRFYREGEDLIVLKIDPARLQANVVCENLEGGAELFPHVYGPITLDSVVKVTGLRRTEDGAWAFDPS